MNSTLRSIPVTASLDDPFYYLRNFHFVLDWVAERYDDLLTDSEHEFIGIFTSLPRTSQALMARMVMRKGVHFRTSRLRYAEIGDPAPCVTSLAEAGLVTLDPELDTATLLPLVTVGELRQALGDTLAAAGVPGTASKKAMSETLLASDLEARCWSAWWPQAPDGLVKLEHEAWFERLRLMFFGNFRQDWSEFVLAELGIQRFESVPLSRESRAFAYREEVERYCQLQHLRERLDAGEAPERLHESLPAEPYANTWLDSRRERVAFRLAREAERQGDTGTAMAIYPDCRHPEARVRQLRVMERQGNYELAYQLASDALVSPRNEAEVQHLERLMPRLCRRLGRPLPARMNAGRSDAVDRLALTLPVTPSVEWGVATALHHDEAPVYYVENTLFGALFGLLCWDAIFAPLPGAFFHPFHTGPSDLYRGDFVARRESLFAECLGTLDVGTYRQRILDTYQAKKGIASPFVHWDAIDETLLEHALHCMPADHLRRCFERMLVDLKANRAGFPDLIQFWPCQQRYRLIEVKGPGDRLQDNQRRWLAFFQQHDMPAVVCHVTWQESDHA
ncbi:VRR-NUC domain-containing protein [Aidingimonas halophila]|uniref:phosphodiesterase I n=1 Tax=Aidingimonas halophila TaxID=574349 RepID=A0A1H2ZG48_9GAMM|nr:VRR-NUC domain-containing protein [Aidingimonas halophila]GHC15978.1 Fanconi-associated nuclease [Aidingimonas halophila]SDX16346.1 VRR-NUC domain-containing protein [Aidingimonas halophila]